MGGKEGPRARVRASDQGTGRERKTQREAGRQRRTETDSRERQGAEKDEGEQASTRASARAIATVRQMHVRTEVHISIQTMNTQRCLLRRRSISY